jgi:hypothetical protein
MVFIDDN